MLTFGGGEGYLWESECNDVDIVAFHGFTGSPLDFESLVEFSDCWNWHALACPGHNQGENRTVNQEISLFHSENYNHHVHSYFQSITGTKSLKILLGYSMGGRYALRYLLQYPNDFDLAIIIGADGGIKLEEDRKSRVENDSQWITLLEKEGIDLFNQAWTEQPIIRTQLSIESPWRDMIFNRKKNGDAIGWKNSLQFFGAGAILPIWDQLEKIKIPTLLCSGVNDSKYSSSMKEMSCLIPFGDLANINKACHACHLENPKAFVKEVKSFISRWRVGGKG